MKIADAFEKLGYPRDMFIDDLVGWALVEIAWLRELLHQEGWLEWQNEGADMAAQKLINIAKNGRTDGGVFGGEKMRDAERAILGLRLRAAQVNDLKTALDLVQKERDAHFSDLLDHAAYANGRNRNRARVLKRAAAYRQRVRFVIEESKQRIARLEAQHAEDLDEIESLEARCENYRAEREAARDEKEHWIKEYNNLAEAHAKVIDRMGRLETGT